MNTDLALNDRPAHPIVEASPLDGDPTQFRAGLARRGANRRALVEWVREALVDGSDFGSITNRNGSLSKPSLRKPGAEKISGMLGITVQFPTLADYERAALAGTPIGTIILRCHLLAADGRVLAEGIGARSLDQDGGDVNKCLKMACKSAHIDAVLRLAGLSEIFTQDLEDMRADAREGDAPPPAQSRQPPPAQSAVRPCTQPQRKLIETRLQRAGIPIGDFCSHFTVDSIEQIPFDRVNVALDWIGGGAP